MLKIDPPLLKVDDPGPKEFVPEVFGTALVTLRVPLGERFVGPETEEVDPVGFMELTEVCRLLLAE